MVCSYGGGWENKIISMGKEAARAVGQTIENTDLISGPDHVPWSDQIMMLLFDLGQQADGRIEVGVS